MNVIGPDDLELDGDIYDEDVEAETVLQSDTGHDELYQARKAGVTNEDGVEDDGGLYRIKEEEVAKGDQFMAVKPWLGAMQPPTGYKKQKGDDDQPDAN